MRIICKICNRIIQLDKTKNNKEKYIQCTCGRIFLNPYFENGNGRNN